MRLSHFLALVMLVAILLTASCDEDETPKRTIAPEMKIDAALSKVSPMAAFVSFNMEIQKTMNCITSNGLDKTDLLKKNPEIQESATDINVNRIISEMMDNYKNRCSLFIEVKKTTGPVFEKIKEERKLPSELYVFSVYSKTSGSNEDDILFKEQEVGLFDSRASCEVIENFAHEKNIPVQQCRKWEDFVKLLKKSAM